MLSVFLKKRKVLSGFLATLAILITVAGGYGYSIWRQVEDAGSLTLFLQQKMSENADGVFSSIEKAELELNFHFCLSGSMPAISGLTLLIRLSCCRNLNFASVGLI